jgi:hypothetical protein
MKILEIIKIKHILNDYNKMLLLQHYERNNVIYKLLAITIITYILSSILKYF